jgi:hypothetical protein
MGLLETIEALDLSDEEKATLRAEYEGDLAPIREDANKSKRELRRDTVEAEIKEFSDLGFPPGVLKLYRRIQLSDDAQEPGAVLLSDDDLNLADDQRTGARSREDVSVAGACKQLMEAIKTSTDADGTVKSLFSDQAIAAESTDKPDVGDASDKTQKSKDNLAAITGRSVERSKTRYRNGGVGA